MGTYQTTLGRVGNSATVSTAAVTLEDDFGFTAAELAAADRALITSIGAAVRYRHDGVAPEAALGHYLPEDASPPLEVLGNANILGMQFIRDTGAVVDATVLITLEW